MGVHRIQRNVNKRFLALRKEVAAGRMTVGEAKMRLHARVIAEQGEALKRSKKYWNRRVKLKDGQTASDFFR